MAKGDVSIVAMLR